MGKEEGKKKEKKALVWDKKKKALAFIVAPILLISLLLFVVLPAYTQHQAQVYEAQRLEKEEKEGEEQSLIGVEKVEKEEKEREEQSLVEVEEEEVVEEKKIEEELEEDEEEIIPPTPIPAPAPTPTPAHTKSPGDKFVKWVSKGEKIAVTSEFGGRMGGPLITLQVLDENGSNINPLTTGHLVGETGQVLQSGKYHKPLDYSRVAQFDGMKLHIGCQNYGEYVYALTDGWLSRLFTTEYDNLPNVNYLILLHDDGGESVYSHIE